MNKKHMAFILAGILTISHSVYSFAADVPANPESPKPSSKELLKEYSDSVYYTYYYSDGGIIYFDESQGSISKCDPEVVSAVIPENINGIPVTKVGGESGFQDCTSLESVYLPDSVRFMGTSCFDGCSSLKDLRLPVQMDEIRAYAFNGCTSLENVVLPEGIQLVGQAAFRDCSSLQDIVIPKGVQKIGLEAMSGCKALTEVYLPKSLKSVDAFAFKECTQLKDIYYEGSREDWKKIQIQSQNKELLQAEIHYNTQFPETAKERVETFISGFYTNILGRQASPEEIRNFSEALMKGEVSAKDVAYSFITSEEFQVKEMGCEDYIQAVYKGLLNRDVDPEGLAYWSGIFNEDESKEEVLDGLIYSPEYYSRVRKCGLNANWQ